MPIYDDTPAHSFLKMLDPANVLARATRPRMAARTIDSVEQVRVFQRLEDGHGSLSPEHRVARRAAQIVKDRRMRKESRRSVGSRSSTSEF
jgi:hypothetical protein